MLNQILDLPDPGFHALYMTIYNNNQEFYAGTCCVVYGCGLGINASFETLKWHFANKKITVCVFDFQWLSFWSQMKICFPKEARSLWSTSLSERRDVTQKSRLSLNPNESNSQKVHLQ